MMSEESVATALLLSRIVDNGTNPLKASEFWKLPGKKSALLGLSHKELIDVGIEEELAERILRLFDRATILTFELQKYEDSGIKLLTPDDEKFPARLLDRLGPKSPALFHAVGNLELLNQPGIGIVGSRNVSEDGAQTAKNIAKKSVELSHVVVSGGARGVDQISMNASYENNGQVVGILADSMIKTINNAETRRVLLEEANTALITPYAPNAPFNVGNAMGRNKVIYGMSHLTVVVATDEDTGGTWNGATESLRNGFGRVAVWRGKGEGLGNSALERKGGERLESLEAIEKLLNEPDEIVIPPPDSLQEKLFE